MSSAGPKGRLSPHGLEMETKASRLGQASNPNRAEMPSTGRRTSYDPVSLEGGREGGRGGRRREGRKESVEWSSLMIDARWACRRAEKLQAKG